MLRRDTGALGIADILLLVLSPMPGKNAMAGGYETVADSAVLVLTIALWSWGLNWASFRFYAVRRLVKPPPLELVRRGRLVRHNLRAEHISVPELMSALREHGIDKLAEVKMARMGSDGGNSVIRQEPPKDSHNRQRPGQPACVLRDTPRAAAAGQTLPRTRPA